MLPQALVPANPWSGRRWGVLLGILSLATLVIHGFHPFAEDGGLYAAGVEYTLDPTLFPHYTGFVTEHLRFSLFAPALALATRATHLPLAAVLLLLDLVTAFFTLVAAHQILRRCVPDEHSQLAGLSLLTAGWTLPIAGTSLYLMDPYVTARSITMPLSLLAIGFALDVWPRPGTGAGISAHPGLRCAMCLLIAAAFHPLMATYALLFVAAIKATTSARPYAAWCLLTTSLLLVCMAANALAPPETPAETAAVITRYYWFLSRWHWYERLGLLGPLVMLGLVSGSGWQRPGDERRERAAAFNPLHSGPERRAPGPARTRRRSYARLRRFTRQWVARTFTSTSTRSAPPRQHTPATLAKTAILLGLLGTLCALFFAHEAAPTHTVARLQPLRVFLLVYAVMLLLLGATLHRTCTQRPLQPHGPWRHALRMLPALATAAMAAGLFFSARATYPASPHIELPWQDPSIQNPWVQAFLWARANTPPDALFALDAHYVNTPGEDAQTFRAISLRSALPDYSKDGGEASITPALAAAWLAAANAQQALSTLPDAERDRRLRPFAVTWMVLAASATTTYSCPYTNGTVKVCRL